MARRYDIEKLFRLYYRPLCLYATHYLQSTDSIEDIVQEAFVSLYQKLDDGSTVNSAESYLFASVRNGCIDFLRKRKTHPEEILPEELGGIISDDETVSDSFDESLLWNAIDRLPDGRRKMLLMHKRDGMKYSEIAEELGVSERTVRNQISRALRSLRRGLGKFIFFFL